MLFLHTTFLIIFAIYVHLSMAMIIPDGSVAGSTTGYKIMHPVTLQNSWGTLQIVQVTTYIP